MTRGAPVPLSYLAVAAEPWPGAVAVWRSGGEGAPFALHRLVDHPACLGRTLSVLPPGPLWRFDRNARLDVTLRHADGLGSVTEAAALSGANLFALVGPDGVVEILSAAGAVLTGPDTWRLTTLLRGLAGSEAAAGRAVPAGSLIVRLDDGAVVPLVERLDEAGRRFLYRIGPAGRDPADPAFIGLEATAGLTALVPLSPVHLRARREAGGLRLSWTRRARRDADAWDPPTCPSTRRRRLTPSTSSGPTAPSGAASPPPARACSTRQRRAISAVPSPRSMSRWRNSAPSAGAVPPAGRG